MNATLTETKEQERMRLLQELYPMNSLLHSACRAQQWSAMAAYAREVARIGELLELNEKEKV